MKFTTPTTDNEQILITSAFGSGELIKKVASKKKMNWIFYIYFKSTNSIYLWIKTSGMELCHISNFFTKVHSYIGVSYRNILYPCLFMTVQIFASHPGILYFYQLCINIDPITVSSVSYLRRRSDACWRGDGISLGVLNSSYQFSFTIYSVRSI